MCETDLSGGILNLQNCETGGVTIEKGIFSMGLLIDEE